MILLATLMVLVPATFAFAGQRSRDINDNDTVAVRGNVPDFVRADHDRGPASVTMQFDRMILALRPRAGAEAEIAKLVADLNDPSSPRYHQWLSPEEFGQRFGISDDDLQAVSGWLNRNGFKVEEVGKGRMWINFSGSVADVERTFKTQIRNYDVDGNVYHANATDLQIPRGLLPLVHGVVTLHNRPRQAMNHGFKKVAMPEYTSGTSHYVSPADFATIYNLGPQYSAGINGTGQTIAIVGRTDIALADVQYFRSFFGLPVNNPTFVHNGTTPGNLGGGEEGEADLDVEWSGAVAPNATIKFVVSASTQTTDGVDLSAQYIVNNNLAAAMSTSFGQCESSMGATENTFYNNLWSQAASQGITSFVSSGDSGAAGCNGGNDTSGSGAAVSGLASTPFNVAVGGTQFNDTSSPSTYWNSTNNSTNQSSAKSYIPEIAWNESGNVSGGSGLWASSGGASSTYTKPSWQVCVGVPTANHRYVPDISLTAAGHDGYLVVQGHTSTVSGLGAVGGTSASSPSFAGLMALINQKTGARQGNANTKFYSLANAQYTGGAVMFHDVTSGNNSVPGVTGFSCGTGYDAVTGVGTVDANALINGWSGTPTPDFAISASPTSTSIVQGGSGNVTVSTTVSGGFNSAVSLSASGLPAGASASFSPASIAAPGSGSSTMTISTGSAAAGTYTVTVTGTGGSKTHTATVTLTVTAAATPDFSISASPTSTSIAQGGSGNVTVSTSVSGGFNSAISLSASGLPSGASASFSPASIAAPGSGSSTMTISTGSAAAGTYTITVTGTGGSTTHSATVSLTVTTSGGTTTQILANPGFESGNVSWTTTSGVITNSTSRTPHAGSWYAWLDGYGTTHTDSAYQQVTIPSGATAATLSFYLKIDTAETTTTTAYDTLQVQIRNSAGTVLATLASYSNLNKSTSYAQKSFNLLAYKGQTIRVYFLGAEDSSLQTSFLIDDTALQVTQ